MVTVVIAVAVAIKAEEPAYHISFAIIIRNIYKQHIQGL